MVGGERGARFGFMHTSRPGRQDGDGIHFFNVCSCMGNSASASRKLGRVQISPSVYRFCCWLYVIQGSATISTHVS